MPRYLDMNRWNRKQQFFFFREYDHPYFNICAPLDVTRLLQHNRATGSSFFLATLYLSQKTANEVEPFRYRIRDDRVLIHDRIYAGSTVLNQDDTFSFCYFQHAETFSEFERDAQRILDKFKQGEKCLNPRDDDDGLIHYSVIPWVAFTSFAHARKHDRWDSVPKIVFGKRDKREGITSMPVSVEVHHALMDGIHVGRYFQQFQAYLDEAPDSLD